MRARHRGLLRLAGTRRLVSPREVEFTDALATRSDEPLYVEARAETSSPGLDGRGHHVRPAAAPDDRPDDQARYAVVVPSSALTAAQRLPEWVPERLRLDVYGVDDDGQVLKA